MNSSQKLLCWNNCSEVLLDPRVRHSLSVDLDHLSRAVRSGNMELVRRFGSEVLRSLSAEDVDKLESVTGERFRIVAPTPSTVTNDTGDANKLSDHLNKLPGRNWIIFLDGSGTDLSVTSIRI